MKRLFFLSACFIVVLMGAFGIYRTVNWHNTIDTHSLPDGSREQLATEVEPSPQQETVLKKEDTTAPPETESNGDDADLTMEHTHIPKKNNDDWRSEAAAPPTQTRQDPWTDQKAPDQETLDPDRVKYTLTSDPESMDPDIRHNAEYEQLLQQHGDIPEVHIVMDYNRRWENNEPLTLEESIEGLTATLKLFPSESTRKTLELYKWMQSKGATSLQDDPAMTPADREYLRSKGISVTETTTQEGVILDISTK